ncbi:hypothetical protein [Paenibacillus polymyxa]|uniref:Uncharacterized protein n=1 Tax=Paenibacillus polymyxa (strain SC2) TaxID=886882 RepID=E3EKM8_PAEPS|nr:hypothetical protein [Paenibacillus polymyxa]ADO59860.1 hypothetical protein PPSC2_25890 [Paenibacillus polymyxa SC2]WPQ59912.1 hypothetical protein SKN87_27090 [Paenibacillus polymyxa]
MKTVEQHDEGNLKGITLNMILTKVFNWAYENDPVLYKNLDLHFKAQHCRSALSEDEMREVFLLKLVSKDDVLKLLTKAITLSDFHHTNKFSWVFGNSLSYKEAGSEEWKDSYRDVISQIQTHFDLLRDRGFDSWHKSTDLKKHNHFRFWMNKFLRDDQLYFLRFFVQHTGNLQSFDTLYVGTNESESYHAIIQYILDQNICPDPHHKELQVPDFVNPDIYNPRSIQSSGRFGGFHYLVYLTAAELQEIYETSLLNEQFNYMEKSMWSYINASSTDKETRFFLFLT